MQHKSVVSRQIGRVSEPKQDRHISLLAVLQP